MKTQSIVKVALRILESGYKNEALLLLKAYTPASSSMQRTPVDSSEDVATLFSSVLKKHPEQRYLLADVKNLLQQERIWLPFQGKVLAINAKYLTYWVANGKDLYKELRHSQQWKEISGSDPTHKEFATKKKGHLGDIRILVDLDVRRSSFQLEALVHPDEEEEEEVGVEKKFILEEPVLLLNEDKVHPSVSKEIPDTIERAVASGAQIPLEYVGAGMTGIVYKDARGKAYKVGRHLTATNKSLLSDEAEWLKAANSDPEVAPHVVDFYRYDPRTVVLVREHIEGSPGGWAQESSLRDLMLKIDHRMMSKHGWSAPEFKGDSFVYRGGRPILVDASMPHRFGENLLDHVTKILKGQKPALSDSYSDLAFYIRMELADGNITREQALPILEALGKPLEED